jgi:hypothetical protein
MRPLLVPALVAAWIIPTLIVITGCNRRPSLDKACPHDDGLQTYAQWQKQTPLPYKAPEEKFRRIRDNYDHVGVGSTKAQIMDAFGPPDFEEEGFPKVRSQSCFYEFTYYFEKPTDLANVIKDKQISVFFTASGRARWIVGNVGLPEKGGPSPVQSN